MRTTLAVVAALVVAASFAASASAARKNLWYDPKVDAVASDIAGTSVRVDGEDDWSEWAYLVSPEDPYAVLGFTAPFVAPSSLLYHRIFITPALWPTLAGAVDNAPQLSQESPDDLYKVAVAILTLTHEAYHIKLLSGDENRVNACALQALPAVLTRDFGVPSNDTHTTTVPVTTRARVKQRLKVHGRWVTRYRWTTKTSYATTATTSPNATFTALVADAQDFYKNAQPASYNTGTCF